MSRKDDRDGEGRVGRPPKAFSAVERDWIASQLGKLSIREMADRLGRPKSTVGREAKRLREERGLPMPADPRYPEPAEPDPPDGELERLRELAATLRAAFLAADERNLPKIASEYRETLHDIERLEGGDDDDGSGGIAVFLQSLRP